eukprot:TRINITY_DN559_c0_g1_i5.p1 TRINITY_DN559_c0_g1~~TRINITY_DN559_c0_g1_i5.p1  ORF type:complete len:2419 (+),score=289.01 TRINITY_DN559_c0_g1_i5:154-7410(+)
MESEEVGVHCLKCGERIAPASSLRFYEDESGGIHLGFCGWKKDISLETNPKRNKMCPRIIKHTCGAKVGNETKIGRPQNEEYSLVLTLARDESFLTNEKTKPTKKKKMYWRDIQSSYPQILHSKIREESSNARQRPVHPTIYPSEKDLSTPYLKKSKPRPYQEELYRLGLLRSSMVCVPTGCGKTLISIMFIAKMLELNPNKIAVFVVHRIPLVYQQASYIETETDFKVLEVNGEKPARSDLENMAENNQRVLSITADCFNNNLEQRVIRMEDICCLVFDESHNGTGNHPYLKVMKHWNETSTKPLIMCLTASPAEGKDGVEGTKQKILDLCRSFSVVPIYPTETRVQFELAIATCEPKIKLIESNRDQKQLEEIITKGINNFIPLCMRHLFINTDADHQQQVRILRSAQNRFNLSYEEEWNINLAVKLLKIIEIIDMFGTKKGKEALLKFIDDQELALKSIKDQELESKPVEVQGLELKSTKDRDLTLQSIQELKHHILRESSRFKDGHSNRIEKVLKMIRKFDGDKLMIFVRTRAAGTQLLAVLNDEVPYMGAEKIFGHGGADGMQYEGGQKTILDKFRTGRSKILVATSVVEEGLDIPDCSLVIAFDGLTSSKSMMQVRGRARKENSRFVMICKNKQQMDQSIDFLEREKNMKVAIQKLAMEHNNNNYILLDRNAILASNHQIQVHFTSTGITLFIRGYPIDGLKTDTLRLRSISNPEPDLTLYEVQSCQDIPDYIHICKNVVSENVWVLYQQEAQTNPPESQIRSCRVEIGASNIQKAFAPAKFASSFNAPAGSVVTFHEDRISITFSIGALETVMDILNKSITLPILIDLTQDSFILFMKLDFKPQMYQGGGRLTKWPFASDADTLKITTKIGGSDEFKQIISYWKNPIYMTQVKQGPVDGKVVSKQQQIVNQLEHPTAYMFNVRRCIVTPLDQVWLPYQLVMHNRVTREIEPERLLKVQFREEDLTSRLNCCFEKIQRILYFGLKSNDQRIHFKFLGCSASQLKNQTFWFMSEDPKSKFPTVQAVQKWMGTFDSECSIHKMVSRRGLMFTSCFLINDNLQKEQVDDDNDHTDGIGMMSEATKALVAKQLRLPFQPDAVQIRCEGYKGVVANHINTTNNKEASVLRADLSFRPSMKKFSTSKENTSFNVVSWSDYNTGSLNKQAIILLSTLGIKDSVFLDLLKDQLNTLEKALTDSDSAYTALIQANVKSKFLRDANKAKINFVQDPYWSRVVIALLNKQVQDLVEKARIMVPKSQNLLGIIDEYKVLEEGQVFVQIEDREGLTQIITGKVVIFRNPCMHPGDIRIFNAVDIKKKQTELAGRRNCIVFSRDGEESAVKPLAGGDLDGDRYTVIWDPNLIEIKEVEPYSYCSFDTIEAAMSLWGDRIFDYGFETAEVCQMFDDNPFPLEYPFPKKETEYSYMAEAGLAMQEVGKIANAWVALTDKRPDKANDPDCIFLSKIFSMAVDSPKTGVKVCLPPKFKPTEYPDYMNKKDLIETAETYSSNTILGKIYKRSRRFYAALGHAIFQNKRLFKLSKEATTDEEKVTHSIKNYERRVIGVMNNFNIASDIEISSGVIIKYAENYDTDRRNVETSVNILYSQIVEDARSEFFAEFGGELSAFADPGNSKHVVDKATLWFNISEQISQMSDGFIWNVLGDVFIKNPKMLQIRKPWNSLQEAFNIYFKQQRATLWNSYKKRVQAIEIIEKEVRRITQDDNIKLLMHGSSAVLLFDQCSDVDVYIKYGKTKYTLEKIHKSLPRALQREFINKAQIPIIRFEKAGDAIKYTVDLSEEETGIIKTNQLMKYLTTSDYNGNLYQELFVLVNWAKTVGIVTRDLNTRIMSSSQLIWMYISFLQDNILLPTHSINTQDSYSADIKPLIKKSSQEPTNLLLFMSAIGKGSEDKHKFRDPISTHDITMNDTVRQHFLFAYLQLRTTHKIENIMDQTPDSGSLIKAITLSLRMTNFFRTNKHDPVRNWCKLCGVEYVDKSMVEVGRKLRFSIKGKPSQCEAFIRLVQERESVSRIAPSKSFNCFIQGCGLILCNKGDLLQLQPFTDHVHSHIKHYDRPKHRLVLAPKEKQGDNEFENKIRYDYTILRQFKRLWDYIEMRRREIEDQDLELRCTIRIGQYYLLNVPDDPQMITSGTMKKDEFESILNSGRRFKDLKKQEEPKYSSILPLEAPTESLPKSAKPVKEHKKIYRKANVTDTLYTCVPEEIDLGYIITRLVGNKSNKQDPIKVEKFYNGTVLSSSTKERKYKFDGDRNLLSVTDRPLTWIAVTNVGFVEGLDMRTYVKTKERLGGQGCCDAKLVEEGGDGMKSNIEEMGVVRKVEAKWYEWKEKRAYLIVNTVVLYVKEGAELRRKRVFREMEVKVIVDKNSREEQLQVVGEEMWAMMNELRLAFSEERQIRTNNNSTLSQ